MSIVASVKVYDGIVIGAESMTQLFTTTPGNPQPQIIKAYSHAQKIFKAGKPSVGVLTYGGGNIGNRSIESFVHEFSEREEKLPEETNRSIQSVAQRLLTFMNGYYQPAFGALDPKQRPQIGFYVAGYSSPPTAGQHLASEWEFVLPIDQQPRPARADNVVGASWRGVHIPFTRLYFGVDPRVDGILANLGMDQAAITKFRQAVNEQLVTKIAFEGMPLQDAIGFCRYIIDTTIGAATYEVGVPSCGGIVRMAVITQGSFEWLSEPKYNFGRRKRDDN